jgi:hypothetical protein
MAPAPRCAYCRERSVVPEYRPFCSKRCKMADLGRWLSGDYRFPGAAADSSGGPAGPDAGQAPDAGDDLSDPDHEPIR